MTELTAGRLSQSKPETPDTTSRRKTYPTSTIGFDLLATSLTIWFLFGLFLDGWAHNHGKVDSTFFTPWHAVLYSSILAVAAHLSFTQYRNMVRGYAWRFSLPRGYNLSLIGVVIFMLGGGFDFVWHSLFGFEATIDALLSPAHLWLATGAFLFLTGPIRAAWLRPRAEERTGWLGSLSLVIALCGLLSLLTFFTQYAHPFSNARVMAYTRYQVPSDSDFYDVSGIASVLIFTALSMTLLLLATRRWRLPFGSLALILGVNAGLMYWMRHNTSVQHQIGLLVGIGMGVLAEALYRVLRPSAARPIAVRIFAFTVPFVTFTVLFVLLIANAPIFWSIHMWLGVSFLGGITALFLSYLIYPPKLPEGWALDGQ